MTGRWRREDQVGDLKEGRPRRSGLVVAAALALVVAALAVARVGAPARERGLAGAPLEEELELARGGGSSEWFGKQRILSPLRHRSRSRRWLL